MTTTAERLAGALADRYRLERELGVGGMATVWLAEDVRHRRRVAIKVLHPELSAVLGSERFLKEIELTANLQHPHILPLFDSGEAAGLLYYVMPYVDGETLRRRLERERQLPVADAARLGREVADALGYAHRHGVVHRDIKPENILLHEGRALVADFGIALAVRNAGGARITETGLSLGTPQYMSPEQATAERELDARSDVYSLGCVLYEMLAGEPPHSGPTTQAIIAKIITDKPRPIAELRETVPAALAMVVHTALAKLPADRFSSAGEMAAALDVALARPEPTATVAVASPRPGPQAMLRPLGRRAGQLAAAVAIALAALALGWLLGRRGAHASSPSLPPSRLAILAPGLGGSGGSSLERQLVVMPDGSAVIFLAVRADGSNVLMRQPLDAAEATPLADIAAETGNPAISPDGRWLVGASADGRQVMRYPLAGGPGEPLPLPGGYGSAAYLAWASDGTLWFSPNDRGLARLGPGDSVQSFGERSAGLQLQQILPDDRSALMIRRQLGNAGGPAVLLDLRSGAQTPIVPSAVIEARYAAGHLVYTLPDGTLQAVPFDPAARHVTGTAATIASGVSVTGTGIAQFAVAANGTVVYIPEEPRALVLVSRDGGARPATAALHNFHAPRFSPDGRRLSVDFNTADGRDVWILSLDQGTLSRGTFERDGHDAMWMPDGRQLLYMSARSGVLGIYRARPGSAEPAESLLASPKLAFTGNWLRDGSGLVTIGLDLRPQSDRDIAIVRNGGHGPIEPLVASRFEEQYPVLSPDQRWLAFVSDQSGRPEVYVRPFAASGPADGDQVQVSFAGGSEPVWGPDGRELFYRTVGESEPKLMAADVRLEPAFTVTARRALFPVGDLVEAAPHANYAVSPDGRTFAMVRRSPATRIMVIQNLPELVRRLRGAGEERR
jgi:serine/threonine-protein kinase